MGFFKKAKDKNGRQGGELGDDITDLSGFGNDWENIVSQLHDDEATAKKAKHFIRTGTIPGTQVATHARWAVIRELVPNLASTYPRFVAALLLALGSSAERENAASLYCGWVQPGGVPTLYTMVRMGRVDTVERLSTRDIATVGNAFGWPADELLDKIIDTNAWSGITASHLGSVDGWESYVEANIDKVRGALTPAKHDQAAIWGRLTLLSDETLLLLTSEVCDAASANSKTLRKAAGPLYKRLPTVAAVRGLTEVAQNSKPAQRARVMDLAREFDPGEEKEAFTAYLKDTFSSDRSAAVKEALAAFDAPPEAEDAPPAALAPVTIATIDLSKFPKPRNEYQETALAIVNGVYSNSWYSPALLAEAIRSEARVVPDLTPHHVARMWSGGQSEIISPCLALVRDSGLRPTPINITEALRHDDQPDRMVVSICAAVMGADPTFWSPDEIADWLPHHTGDLAILLDERDESYAFNRAGYLLLLTTASEVPGKLKSRMITAAIDGYKSDRELLYRAIGPESIDTVLPFLGSRKRAERVGAANLLRSIGSPEASEALLTAARKENDDMAMVAILGALDTIGAPIDEFISADALLAQATKALGKKNAIPKSLSWLNVDVLPPVSWTDGAVVDPRIMQWFIASAAKGKTAEPSPLVARHFDAMNQEQLRTFGSTLLDLWMLEDTRTFTHEEAQTEAQNQAARYHHWYHNSAGHKYHGLSVQAIADDLAPEIQQTIKGSATSSKGILSIVAASAGSDVADRCSAYIRKHRGHRVNQAKILLQMLAWIDSPTTVQLVMSIAARFRPKGIQVEAAKQAELLAERRGWTLDDLADRSVPDAGFEANGRRVFDYGERTLTAHLEDDLTVTLHNNETGKTVKSLPKGRADEDADTISDLKKDFTASKKELKSVLQLQPVRLHLAMCAQRSWNVDDFTRYFVTHPVMARLASRLVWMSTVGDEQPVGFRPLTDGTLLLENDDEFPLPDDARITIAHGHFLDDEVWMQHLSDYGVAPLFAQFNRPVVPASSTRTIDEFEGYMFNDGTFRGQINKHAWQMGQPQDAGWVVEIVKDVPTVALKAVVNLHGGLSVAAYDVGATTLAFGKLFFVPSTTMSGWDSERAAVELETVPPILLTEMYAEVEAMAHGGDGHDPAYAKKVGY